MTHSYPSGSPGVPESSIPTGAPGLMPRRSSYASVVSGTGTPGNQSYQQPARSGAFSHLLNQTGDMPSDSNYQHAGVSSRYNSRGFDMDSHRNGGSYGPSSSWGRSGRLPSFSHAFQAFTNGYGFEGVGAHVDYFFIPSYLKGSKHVQRLEAAYKTKLASRKDAPPAQSSQPGLLSKSNSSANLHTPVTPSHRGISYDVIENRGTQFDVIEKAPPLEDESLAPLPSRWNNQDKYTGLEVQGDGQEVKYTGTRSSDRDHEASSIRTDHSIPPQCGIYYFEVTILSRKRDETSICIGFSSKDVSLARPPGWEPESWAYHGDDGHSYCCQNSGKHYGPPYSVGDVIGCGINFRTGCAFFTKNGDNLGTAFREIKGKLFPSVGMKKPGEHVRINLGQSPFIFDIDGMMSVSLPIHSTSDFLLSHINAIDDHSTSASKISFHADMTTQAIMSEHNGTHVPELPESEPSHPFFGVLELSDDDAMAREVRFRQFANHLTQREKHNVKQQVEATSTEKLAPPLDETSLIQSLVLQYLSHDDYVETAKAFAQEVHAEREALDLSHDVTSGAFDYVKEDEDAINRQRIRMAILDGDVDKALKYTNAFYPSVLKENEYIYFRLRSRKFIEMIRRAAEIRSVTINGSKRTNGHTGDWYDDVINHDMELDDPPVAQNGWDKMDTESTHDSQADYNRLLHETIQYGQVLQAEFEHDSRREIQKSLTEAFALLAYEDPINSKEVSHLLRRDGRVSVAEELNAAILVSLGKSSSAALERVIQQTTVLIDDLRDTGGPGALININDYLKPQGSR